MTLVFKKRLPEVVHVQYQEDGNGLTPRPLVVPLHVVVDYKAIGPVYHHKVHGKVQL